MTDLSNDDPEASRQAVERARLQVQRLLRAGSEFKSRVDAIDRRAAAEQWSGEYKAVEAERDALADELAGLYPAFVAQLTDLYARIDQNTRAIDHLHASAPAGEDRRLADAELAARGRQSYTGDQPRLRDNLRLPAWGDPRVVSFPVDELAEFQRSAALVLANAVRTAEQRQLGYGPDWHEAAKLRDEERRAELAKAEEREKQRQAESLEALHAAQRRHDLARRGIRPDSSGAAT